MASRKKILHLIQSLDNGGCENMLLRTLPLLTEEFEHHIITLRELGELAPRFAEKGIAVTTIHWQGLFDVSGYRRLLSETRQFEPDIVITYLFHADMLGRLYLQNNAAAPVIPFLRTTYNHPKYLIARIFEWLTKPLVKQYLANSEAVKHFYISQIGVKPEKITVIPNGIDTEYYDSILRDPRLRSSLGISPQDPVLISVANLHVNKGHRYLLEAFEQAFQTFPSLHLLIVGDGDERKNLLHQVASYTSKDHIHFLGRRQDVPQLLKISDLFILPTLFEGQSNAILEAMACGIPVITTDIEENKELIKDNGTGILALVKNSDAILGALEKLLMNNNFRSQIGEAAEQFIKENFSLKKIARDWNNLLAEYTQS